MSKFKAGDRVCLISNDGAYRDLQLGCLGTVQDDSDVPCVAWDHGAVLYAKASRLALSDEQRHGLRAVEPNPYRVSITFTDGAPVYCVTDPSSGTVVLEARGDELHKILKAVERARLAMADDAKRGAA